MTNTEYNYRVTNTSDDIHMMEDDGRTRRFNPGASKKTTEQPDGRENWYEIEKINPDAEDIKNSSEEDEEEN